MKKNLFSFLLVFSFCCSLTAQPQWKFHIAYEDATGAKDTIWLIWDTTATFYGIDTLLGEGNPGMNYNEFNVWTLTGGPGWNQIDTTKVVAHPYEYSFGPIIEAMNFILPITISWDSSLFHAPWLPPQPVGWINHARIDNHYFFWNWNNPWVTHYYDMTIDNKVIAPIPGSDPWFWQDWIHFPMSFIIYQDPTLGTPMPNKNPGKDLIVYPNPAGTQLWVSIPDDCLLTNTIIEVVNSEGRKTTSIKPDNQLYMLETSRWHTGLYILKLWDGKQWRSEKVVVK
jgi:hypothetical protein